MKKLLLVIGLSSALLASTAEAALSYFNVSFIDPTAQNIANGLLGVEMANGLAVSGTLTVFNGVAAGSYNLLPTTTPGLVPYLSYPGAYLTPSGAFYFDNRIMGIPPGPPSYPFVDLAGLAFVGTGTQTGTEINLFSDNTGVNAYAFYGWNNGVYGPQAHGGAAISLSSVPEPTTMVAGALLLLPFAASTIRKMRPRA
jgi:hypothetical protein